MIALVTGLNQAKRVILPDRISGSYHIYGDKDDVIAIVSARDGKWVIAPNGKNVIQRNGAIVNEDTFDSNVTYFISNQEKNRVYGLYIYNAEKTPFNNYEVKSASIRIGRTMADISFTGITSDATLTFNKNWIITASGKNVYVNDQLVKQKTLLHGDIVFIDGLKIIPYSNRIILVNLTEGQKLAISRSFEEVKFEQSNDDPSLYSLETERSIFEGKEYFTKAPRFHTTYEPKRIKFSPPPAKQSNNMQPAILTIGPQLTMMLTSGMNIFMTINNAISGNGSIKQVMPSILISLVMMVSSFLWPTLSRKWQKRNQRKQDKLRIMKYRSYLKRKEKEIIEEIGKEKQVLVENNVTLEECQQIIYNRKRNLWERDIIQSDFLNVRLGIGNVKPSSQIEYEEADFSTDDNVLVDEVRDMIHKYDYIENVPQCISLVEKETTAVLGAPLITQKFINSIVLQLMTFHSFLDLKIVIFTNSKNALNWEYCDILPHCWNNQRNFRYIGTNVNELKTISAELMKEFKARKNADTKNNEEEKTTDQVNNANSKKNTYMNYPPYYLIIIDDLDMARDMDIIQNILESRVNLGFSLLIKNDKISNLPSKCSTFINITDGLSGLFENELVSSKQKQFTADINNTVNMYGCATQLSNIPFELPKAKYDLPKSISFLDMYEVGNIEQLNSLDRWKKNNPIASLSVPVGIDQNGSLFNMDIHEKAYGPHGLVAGTTGSGKSEWIITYILSLAVNFHPEEVQFVLIDYKGGGLAGSFENSQVGIRLPHLVGTITNLDKSEVRRAIASIESELKRRQRLFNEAREKLKDSSMNIYKYQDYYRQGLLDEPMSHLFIISDEFAELKSQQPEFLDQLVSTARIGRSLGVHLILATQKPSGVVNDQIWSNSRFKVCLRVADVGDSTEMLKKPDAAYLKTTGAFYLQVGNDEYYMLGQSAYAGFKYIPSNTVKKKIDTDIHVIDKIGNELNTITDLTAEDLNANRGPDLGEELLNILKYVDRLAKEENIHPRKLWLDRIPDIIFIDDIKKKYNYQKEQFKINPVLGEYDDPYTQSQKIFTLPFNQLGNIAIYGSVGSGKELLLLSLIYSLSSTYTINECNVYAIDCGAQILKACATNPIVGNIVNYEDEDQVDGVFIYIKNELKVRKNLFADYGGDYEQFIKTSGKSLPNIILIINNIPAFLDKYDEMLNEIVDITSSCTKYGIYLVISTLANLQSKIAQNFGGKLALNFNDDADYRNVFPRNNTVFPARAKSRGIFEKDNVIYEFQTAIPTYEENINQLMEKYSTVLYNAYKNTVPSVPYIPKFVTYDLLKNKVTDMSNVPIGIRKINVKTEFINFKGVSGSLIFGANVDYLEDFTKNLVKLISNIKDDAIYLFDPKKNLEEYVSDNITYIKTGFDEVISNLAVYVKDIYDKIEAEQEVDTSLHSFIIINGVDKFSQSVTRETLSFMDNIGSMLDVVKNVHIILIETTNNMRGYITTPWVAPFRQDGICLGPGANEQMVIDIRKFDVKVRKDIAVDNYGYNIIDGKGEYFKFVEDEKTEEDEI